MFFLAAKRDIMLETLEEGRRVRKTGAESSVKTVDGEVKTGLIRQIASRRFDQRGGWLVRSLRYMFALGRFFLGGRELLLKLEPNPEADGDFTSQNSHTGQK